MASAPLPSQPGHPTDPAAVHTQTGAQRQASHDGFAVPLGHRGSHGTAVTTGLTAPQQQPQHGYDQSRVSAMDHVMMHSLGSARGDASARAQGGDPMSMLCSTPFGDTTAQGGSEQGVGDRLDPLLMSPMGTWDPSLLLMSPRMATPLYAKVGASSLNSPVFPMSPPTHWWASGAGANGAGSSGLGLLGPGPMSVSASPLRGATGWRSTMPGVSGAMLAQAAARLVTSEAVGEVAVRGVESPVHPGGTSGVQQGSGAQGLVKMSPGTTVLSPVRPGAGVSLTLGPRTGSAPVV